MVFAGNMYIYEEEEKEFQIISIMVFAGNMYVYIRRRRKGIQTRRRRNSISNYLTMRRYISCQMSFLSTYGVKISDSSMLYTACLLRETDDAAPSVCAPCLLCAHLVLYRSLDIYYGFISKECGLRLSPLVARSATAHTDKSERIWRMARNRVSQCPRASGCP